MLAVSLTVAAALAAAGPVELSSDLSDYNLSYDACRATLVLAKSEAEFRNARIFVAVRSGNGWTDRGRSPFPILAFLIRSWLL